MDSGAPAALTGLIDPMSGIVNGYGPATASGRLR
jgi:hypothetical protein